MARPHCLCICLNIHMKQDSSQGTQVSPNGIGDEDQVCSTLHQLVFHELSLKWHLQKHTSMCRLYKMIGVAKPVQVQTEDPFCLSNNTNQIPHALRKEHLKSPNTREVEVIWYEQKKAFDEGKQYVEASL